MDELRCCAECRPDVTISLTPMPQQPELPVFENSSLVLLAALVLGDLVTGRNGKLVSWVE